MSFTCQSTVQCMEAWSSSKEDLPTDSLVYFETGPTRSGYSL